jgi:hypothetical protein
MLRIHVAIATVGRASLARQTINLLAGQSRQPDGVIAVGAAHADLAGLADSSMQPSWPWPNAACAASATARSLLAGVDVVIFFDDDFVLRLITSPRSSACSWPIPMWLGSPAIWW